MSALVAIVSATALAVHHGQGWWSLAWGVLAHALAPYDPKPRR